MSTDDRSVIGSLLKISKNFGISPDVPEAALVPNEDLIVRYTRGEATFSKDKKYISAHGKMFMPNGDPDGHWAAEYDLLVPLAEAWRIPEPPPPPFNRPVPPVPEPPSQMNAKGTWTFGDGSWLTAVGQGILHAARFQTRDSSFWISANQLISNGYGRYERAQGLKIAGISILIPPDIALEDAPSLETPPQITTIEVFRIARSGVIGKPPSFGGLRH